MDDGQDEYLGAVGHVPVWQQGLGVDGDKGEGEVRGYPPSTAEAVFPRRTCALSGIVGQHDAEEILLL